MNTEVDHLVVVCDTLVQGAAWCERTLGLQPGPGGRHALMGTHNLLLSLASAAFPQAYLELIAIDPEAPSPGRARWFGIDDPTLRAAVVGSPRLRHVVLRSPNIEMHRWGLVNLGLDPGVPLAAERETPEGRLAWRILVRDDGAIACDGALPTLIEWQGRHPSAAMAASPLQLRAVALAGLSPQVRAVLSPRGVSFAEPQAAAGARLHVQLATPRGVVNLRSA